MAEAIRVGLGFDVHPRDAGRPLWLGTVRFEGEEGLAGHSDGDAVCHALADGMLGAAALGDIGEQFPDTDPEIAGISGSELLIRAIDLVQRRAALRPVSCDLTVVCDRPLIGPRRHEMRERLAAILEVPADRVSLKATRPEGLGLHGDGVGCLALVVLG
jgi:2-C-methyl-D-erythritol 2,4-cyclodiphosphate synthase